MFLFSVFSHCTHTIACGSIIYVTYLSTYCLFYLSSCTEFSGWSSSVVTHRLFSALSILLFTTSLILYVWKSCFSSEIWKHIFISLLRCTSERYWICNSIYCYVCLIHSFKYRDFLSFLSWTYSIWGIWLCCFYWSGESLHMSGESSPLGVGTEIDV